MARLFGYLNEVTPVQVNITNFTATFTDTTITITGTSDSLSSVNKYIDTLKFTNYKVEGDDSSDDKPAFGNVVLTSFGISNGAKPGEAANYTITLSYDPAIFDTTQTVKLEVPSKVTTRSQLDKPPALFTAAPAPTTEGSN